MTNKPTKSCESYQKSQEPTNSFDTRYNRAEVTEAMRAAELQGAMNAAQEKLESHQTQTQVNSEVRAKALKFVKVKLAEAEAAVLAAAPVSDSKVASIISDDLEIQQPELLTPSQVKDLLVPIEEPVSGQVMTDLWDLLVAEGITT